MVKAIGGSGRRDHDRGDPRQNRPILVTAEPSPAMAPGA